MSCWDERAARRLALCLCAWGAALPASGKVLFTGYGNFLFTADANLRLYAPPALLAGGPDGTFRARGFSAESVGLFAATPVGDKSDFLMDLSYRAIGSTVKEIRIQYAYFDTALPWEGTRLQAGKVTLPLGYYNTRRFYPFQRTELSAPIFQSGILGLPMADVGGVLSYHGEASDLGLDVRFFGVNGYGSVPTSTGAFRAAGPPGGLGIANNLGSGNNNRDVAVGGQVALSRGKSWEYGVSYYRGAWDRSAERLFQLTGSHVHWAPRDFDVLVEYVHLAVGGDEGMRAAYGRDDWTLDGAQASVSGPAGSAFGRPLRAFGRGELYDGGANDGTGGHELLRSAAAGLALKASDLVTWKGEYLWLDYRIPQANAKGIVIMGYIAQLALVVTF